MTQPRQDSYARIVAKNFFAKKIAAGFNRGAGKNLNYGLGDSGFAACFLALTSGTNFGFDCIKFFLLIRRKNRANLFTAVL